MVSYGFYMEVTIKKWDFNQNSHKPQLWFILQCAETNYVRKFANGIKASSERQSKYYFAIDEIFVWVHFEGGVSYQIDEI